MPLSSRSALVVFGFVFLAACNEGVSNKSRIPAGKRLGDTCTETGADACRLGLKCDGATQTCVGGGSFANGDACIIGSECQSGYCAPNGNKGICAAGGTVAKGGTCEGDGDCVAGLKCSFDGATMFPRCVTPGVLDVGGACTNNGQCAQGLFCTNDKCTFISMDPSSPLIAHGYPPILPNPTARWQGGSCPASETGPATALWELPRAADGDGVKQDFYRLPFPNDARRAGDGSLDFSRFPKDPAPPFGFDAMGRYLEALKTEPFSNYGATIFRFSAEVKFEGFSAQGANPQLRLVDLTQGTRFGNRRGLFFQYSPGRNRYVCESWLSVRPYTGDVMQPGTYAVVLLKGLTDSGNAQIQSAPDFQAMLSATAPADPVQAAAWPAYAPLRQYLTQQSINTADVLTASVFTVGDGQRLSRSLADSVTALGAPTADAWVKCGSGTPSPCPDATGTRACGNASAFDEFHTLIELPIFQQGTTPYLSPAEGGSISSAGGALSPVRREKVCASLTAPKGAAPAGGWPLAVYAHGTGGSYRSHAEDGAGAALASVTIPAGADGGTPPTGYAVLGFDQVGHGPRRGARTDVSPDDIVFNFGNPASARGTMAQGGADLLSVALYAKGLGTSTPAPLPALDTTHLVFWGHSQGATEGGLALAHDRVFDGALLSGASASITDALLSKKAPVNIADAMWIALSEQSSSSVNAFHPAMTLFQMWIDPSDPINHARDVAVVPARGTAPVFARHVFQVWGKNDLFTARPVQAAFALAAGLQLVGPKIEPEYDPPPVTSVQGNITTPKVVTAALRQYQPATAYDGHFVVFRDPTAQRDAVRFLVRAATGDVPRIPEP